MSIGLYLEDGVEYAFQFEFSTGRRFVLRYMLADDTLELVKGEANLSGYIGSRDKIRDFFIITSGTPNSAGFAKAVIEREDYWMKNLMHIERDEVHSLLDNEIMSAMWKCAGNVRMNKVQNALAKYKGRGDAKNGLKNGYFYVIVNPDDGNGHCVVLVDGMEVAVPMKDIEPPFGEEETDEAKEAVDILEDAVDDGESLLQLLRGIEELIGE